VPRMNAWIDDQLQFHTFWRETRARRMLDSMAHLGEAYTVNAVFERDLRAAVFQQPVPEIQRGDLLRRVFPSLRLVDRRQRRVYPRDQLVLQSQPLSPHTTKSQEARTNPRQVTVRPSGLVMIPIQAQLEMIGVSRCLTA
jgi:hypothetical protein